jgi:hypothetical protein
VGEEVVRLVQHMGENCSLWGAERIRGQLLQLCVARSKRTIQRLLAERGPRRDGPSWAVFWKTSILPGLQGLIRFLQRAVGLLRRLVEFLCALAWAARGRPGQPAVDENDLPDPEETGDASEDASEDEDEDHAWAQFVRDHLDQTWACDFFTVVTVDYQVFYVFFVLELGPRRVRHWNVTQHPTQSWTAQQFREATAWCEGPRFLIRDRDSRYSGQGDDVLEAGGTEVLLTPPRRPVCNSFAERLVRTARDELFHHVLVWGEDDLRAKLRELFAHYHARPHQGLEQRSPDRVSGCASPRSPPREAEHVSGPFRSEPVLGGLHRRYHRVA